MNQIKNYPCNYVCITGGEPLLQDDLPDLINNLLENDYIISLETNGSQNIKNLLNFKSLLISLDVKCPSSNMHEKNNFENIKLLRKNDQLKFIIKNKEDYNYAKKVVEEYKPSCTVFFQPVWGANLDELASWMKNDGLDVKLGLQLHKIIWGDTRGI